MCHRPPNKLNLNNSPLNIDQYHGYKVARTSTSRLVSHALLSQDQIFVHNRTLHSHTPVKQFHDETRLLLQSLNSGERMNLSHNHNPTASIHLWPNNGWDSHRHPATLNLPTSHSKTQASHKDTTTLRIHSIPLRFMESLPHQAKPPSTANNPCHRILTPRTKWSLFNLHILSTLLHKCLPRE
jgi:hypothetical protein